MASVLNAFRHQRNSHRIAFDRSLRNRCAQRLSASKELSQLIAKAQTNRRDVLNAFRHQRNSHPDMAQSDTNPQSRAQRLSASKELSRVQINLRFNGFTCSTPFGIKGTLTCTSSAESPPTGCSTPFGIKGTLTDNVRITREDSSGAQRLSASKELSPIRLPFQWIAFQ